MRSATFKRYNIQYKYAIGIAMKNSRNPLLAKEIYDFIIVHMPNICPRNNNSWENAVRSNLSTSDLFEKIEEAPEKGVRPICYYKFCEGAEEKFEEIFPISYGEPYDFLTYPEHHKKLYKGEMGYPTEKEIEDARMYFHQGKKHVYKSIVKTEVLETRFRPTRARQMREMRTRSRALREVKKENEDDTVDYAKNEEDSWTPQYKNTQIELKVEDYHDFFFGRSQDQENLKLYDGNQVMSQLHTYHQNSNFADLGPYQQNEAGPLRSVNAYISKPQTTSYERPSVVYEPLSCVKQEFLPQSYQMYPQVVPAQPNLQSTYNFYEDGARSFCYL